MYHYVRDLAKSEYPRLKAMLLDDFRSQVAWLSDTYEMATSGVRTGVSGRHLSTFPIALPAHIR